MQEQTLDHWSAAQQKCWTHVETSTQMMKTLDALKGLHVTSVIPILSDTTPTILLTPDNADDLVAVKATCRFITAALGHTDIKFEDGVWERLPINDEWVLRLRLFNRVLIDVMTRLPATKESPIEV